MTPWKPHSDANTEFNRCSVFTECCFSFEKGSICQYHSSSDFAAQTLFSTIWKTLATLKKVFISIKKIFLAFLFNSTEL